MCICASTCFRVIPIPFSHAANVRAAGSGVTLSQRKQDALRHHQRHHAVVTIVNGSPKAVDELLLQVLPEFDGQELKSAEKGALPSGRVKSRTRMTPYRSLGRRVRATAPASDEAPRGERKGRAAVDAPDENAR